MSEKTDEVLETILKNTRKQEIKLLLNKIDQLPTLPAVALQILNSSAEDLEIKKTSKLIENDPALTAAILRYANSAHSGLRREIKTIEHALVVIGGTTLLCLVMAIKIHGCFAKLKNDQFQEQVKLWQHALTTAISSEIIAAGIYPESAKEAFIAGLLHDIGKIFICTYFPAEYTRINEISQATEEPILAIEHSLLGADHTLAGKWLGERWNLSAGLRDVIWLHHQNLAALNELQADTRLITIVKLANEISHYLFIDQQSNLFPEKEFAKYLLLLGLSRDELDRILKETEKKFTERAELFDWKINALSLLQEARHRAMERLSSLAQHLEQNNRTLVKTNRMFSITSEIGLQLAKVKSIPGLFYSLADSLRQLSDLDCLLIFWADRENLVIEGYLWERSGIEKTLICNTTKQLEPLSDRDIDKAPPWVKQVLSSFAVRAVSTDAVGTITPEVFNGNHFLILPLGVNGEIIGEICLGRGKLSAAQLESWERMSYSQIAALTAEVLDRIRISSKLNERCEELSTALWKNQQIKLQLFQAERLAAVGQLAAGAAHEINNPLAIISGRAQIQLLKETDPGKRHDLEQIISQIERISSTLNNLLGFARPAPPKIGVVLINEIIERIITLLTSSCESLKINTQKNLEPLLPKIKGDSRQLEQVFLNLAINALHAMEEQGGTLTFSSKKIESGNLVEIRIGDTGSGIRKEFLEQIFDPFFTTKEEGKGTGLGLSTAHGIISNHYGTIDVESEWGKGTVFTVTLPVDLNETRPEKEIRTKLRSVTPPSGKRRILVVDDEPAIREILKESLSTEGYEVDTAAGCDEGLAMLEKTSYNLMLLDLCMPARSGTSLLSTIREKAGIMPVIIITGMASDEEISAALTLGACKCIRKPFHIKSLLRDVKKIVNPEKPGKNTS